MGNPLDTLCANPSQNSTCGLVLLPSVTITLAAHKTYNVLKGANIVVVNGNHGN